MALRPDRSVRAVTLLGWTEPRPYEAGQFNGTPFPAGQSMKVCVGHDEFGFDVLKVKNDDLMSVWPAIRDGLARGASIEIQFTPGQNGNQGRCHGVRALQPAGK